MESSKKWMLEFPKSFWDSPASQSGLYHLKGDTQKSHAFGVLEIASIHWRTVLWKSIRKNRKIQRSFLRAALFHDVGKYFSREKHDLAGFEWMVKKDRLAAYLILFHMGRWGAKPSEKRELIIKHNCKDLSNYVNQRLCEILAGADYFHAVTLANMEKKSRRG